MPALSPKWTGYILAIISSISYGLIPLFIIPLKEKNLSIDLILGYRFGFAALILFAYLLIKKVSFKLNLKSLMVVVTLGLLYSFSADSLLIGYDYLSPGIASTILYVYPILVALIMYFFFKEKLTKSTLLALVITLFGIYVLSITNSFFDINLKGLGVTLLSALTYAIYIVIVNKSNTKLHSLVITFYSLLFSTIYYIVKCKLLGIHLLIDNPFTLCHIAIFSLITTFLSLTCLVNAIQRIGSTPTAIMGSLEPIVALLISVCLFGESLKVNIILGVVLIIIGVVINIIKNK